jgi:hypothetical protein
MFCCDRQESEVKNEEPRKFPKDWGVTVIKLLVCNHLTIIVKYAISINYYSKIRGIANIYAYELKLYSHQRVYSRMR